GGEQALARSRLRSRTATGVDTIGSEIKFSTDLVMDLPDRARDAIEAEVGGHKVAILRIVNGSVGWVVQAGSTMPIGPAELGDVREEFYTIWLTTLAPLKGEAFQLEPLPETNVNGQAVVGVRVASKGHKDVKLYSDK